MCVMAVVGQMGSQARHAMPHGTPSAMVSNGVVNPAGCGHTATHAPHRMHAGQSIRKTTGTFAMCDALKRQTLRYGESGRKYAASVR